MTHFEKLKVMLRELGVFGRGTDPKSKWIVLATRCCLLVVYMIYILTPTWYLVFEAQTPRKHSESLILVLSSLLEISWYSALLFQSEKYSALFDELNAIIETRLIDPTVNLIYEKTKVNIEWVTKNVYLAVRIAGLIYVFIPVALSFFNYFTSGYSNESLQQIYPASYPFDWKTPLGYAACVLIQVVTLIAAIDLYVSIVVLTVGFCMVIADFASDIKEKLRQFNRILISSEELTTDDQIVLKKRLKEIIEFYSEAREFAIRFSDVNSAIVSACPTYTIAVFGSLVLQVNILTKTGDIMGILQITMAVFVSLFPFFLFCHFGGKFTQQFEDIGDAAYQLEWYRLPVEMQKDIGVVIALAQKSIYMRGYGDTRSTYSVFKKILKNKFYYFMVARKF